MEIEEIDHNIPYLTPNHLCKAKSNDEEFSPDNNYHLPFIKKLNGS